MILLFFPQIWNACLTLLNFFSRRRQWHPTPVLLPGKSHGWRSLVGCSPRGRWDSDTTERLHFHLSLSCIGEGNGNPLQYSCLENPRDSGAWWAAVYGVAQSQTLLMRLSSSNSSSNFFSNSHKFMHLPSFLLSFPPPLWKKTPIPHFSLGPPPVLYAFALLPQHPHDCYHPLCSPILPHVIRWTSLMLILPSRVCSLISLLFMPRY